MNPTPSGSKEVRQDDSCVLLAVPQALTPLSADAYSTSRPSERGAGVRGARVRCLSFARCRADACLRPSRERLRAQQLPLRAHMALRCAGVRRPQPLRRFRQEQALELGALQRTCRYSRTRPHSVQPAASHAQHCRRHCAGAELAPPGRARAASGVRMAAAACAAGAAGGPCIKLLSALGATVCVASLASCASAGRLLSAACFRMRLVLATASARFAAARLTRPRGRCALSAGGAACGRHVWRAWSTRGRWVRLRCSGARGEALLTKHATQGARWRLSGRIAAAAHQAGVPCGGSSARQAADAAA